MRTTPAPGGNHAMIGSMQQTPLQISAILRFAATAHPSVPIVSRLVDEPVWRYDYAGLARRATQLARALRDLGIGAGATVATLAWNTHRHLELMYAVPGIGAVLHTANPRLFDDQLVYVLNHGGAEVLFVDKTFLALVERLAPRLDKIRTFVLMADHETPESVRMGALGYEALLSKQDVAAFDWPWVDENAGALLCYTSGTTGDPKGVLYTQRSIVLHALAAGLSGTMNLTAFDVLMPCSSLYHASGWGLPYIAPINGCALVLPCERFDPAGLHELIVAEGVTFSSGVPTIWNAYLKFLDTLSPATIPLKRVLIGGAAVAQSMFEAFRHRGADVLQLWGMTETSPVGVAATPTPALLAATKGDVESTLWTRQGRRVFGLELRIVDENGDEVPADGETSGTVMVRGPWVVQRYFKADTSATDAEGWFDTGDIGTIDARGYMRLTDRAKDVIKSGGEWVSSIDLENEACSCPGVRIAAVVGVPHPRWDERPILIIERDEGGALEAEHVIAHLTERVVKWWLPDRVIFDAVPLTATGKIDKKTLRTRYADIFAGADQ